MLMDSIVWGIKHTMRDISDITLGRKFSLYVFSRCHTDVRGPSDA